MLFSKRKLNLLQEIHMSLLKVRLNGQATLPAAEKPIANRFGKQAYVTSIFVTAVLVLFVIIPQRMLAAAGDLDPTFGDGGKVTTDFGSTLLTSSRITAIALQQDSKIVAAGAIFLSDFNIDLGLARYHPDGRLDKTFGIKGKVTTDLGPTNSDSVDQALAIQSDGKIVVAIAGFSFEKLAIARYNADGSLDSTFGSGGLLNTGIAAAHPPGLVIQPDGKMIVYGISVNNFLTDFVVARYNPDGSPDVTFGTGGQVMTDFHGFSDFPRSVYLQSDGKIIVAGRGANPGTFGNDFGLARYGKDGKLDSGFGSGGKVSTDFIGGDDVVYSLNITPVGKIIAAGVASAPSSFGAALALARYDDNGSLDVTFGSGGKLTAPLPMNFAGLDAIAFQPDGKVVTASVSFTNFEDFGVARYNPDGTLDSSFGAGGRSVTDFAKELDAPFAIAIQPDGKIIAAGGAHIEVNSMFALVRYKADPPVPRIASASVSGKKLIVVGENFDSGAVILKNGVDQKTVPDDETPSTRLIGKKTGKKIVPGDKLQVRNSDGVLSPEFTFTGL